MIPRQPRHTMPAFVCALLLACGEVVPVVSGDGRPERGGVVVVAANSDLDHLNGLVSSERFTQDIIRNAVFMPLLAYDESLQLAPRLAESFDQLGDTAVVFRIRDDVRWHDGVPTTAHDVAFTFRRAKDPETAFPNASYFANWTDVEVLDSLTVRFRFSPHAEPLAPVHLLAIMPRHLLDTIPPARLARAAFNRRPVGNGPFRFVEQRANDRWIFEANPDFPEGLGGRPHIDRLVWRVIPEASVQVVELRTGGVDLILNARPDEVPALERDAQLRLIVRPSRSYAMIAWNGRRAPLDDARVRRALGMAIDRQRIIDALRAGRGQLAVGPIGPNHWSYDTELPPLPHDREAARALLRQAGIEDRNGDGRLETPDGSPFRIELKYPAASAFNRDMAELIRADLAALGVQFVARPTEFGTMVGDISPPARDFDAVLLGWEADFRIDLRNTFHSSARDELYGFAGYQNPAADALIEQAVAATDRAALRSVLHELQRLLRDEQPWAFLYYYPDLFLARARLHGVEMDMRGVFVNVGAWWVPRAEQRARAAAAPADDSVDHAPHPDPAPRS